MKRQQLKESPVDKSEKSKADQVEPVFVAERVEHNVESKIIDSGLACLFAEDEA